MAHIPRAIPPPPPSTLGGRLKTGHSPTPQNRPLFAERPRQWSSTSSSPPSASRLAISCASFALACARRIAAGHVDHPLAPSATLFGPGFQSKIGNRVGFDLPRLSDAELGVELRDYTGALVGSAGLEEHAREFHGGALA